MTKLACAVVVLSLIGCKGKDSAGGGTASGSAPAPAGSAEPAGSAAPAAPVEDVNCRTAGNEYAKKMAVAPGNVLSNTKPDSGLISWTGLSMSDYCDGNDEVA